jgi:hypothetical protein
MRGRPKGGYNNEPKEGYRKILWDIINRELLISKSSAKVCFLPEVPGLEIPRILGKGFREENLFAIDESIQKIAVSKWRKEYPAIKFRGAQLPDAARFFKEQGHRIDVASLDLCSQVSLKQARELWGFASSGVLSPEAIVTITTMGGRESGQALRRLRAPDVEYCITSHKSAVGDGDTVNLHRRRIRTVVSEFIGKLPNQSVAAILGAGRYQGARVPMVWVVFRIIALPTFIAMLKYGKKARWLRNPLKDRGNLIRKGEALVIYASAMINAIRINPSLLNGPAVSIMFPPEFVRQINATASEAAIGRENYLGR